MGVPRRTATGHRRVGESRYRTRGREVVRALREMGLPLAVVAVIFPMAFVAWAAPVNYPNCMFGSHEGCTRAGIELIVIPIGVIAGALLWRRFELAIRLEASRIGPRLPSLGIYVLIGASLVIFWMWSVGYLWYSAPRLSGAVALALGAFVVGRFHPRISAVLAFYIGVPAILAAGTIAACGNSSRYACTAEGPVLPIWGCTDWSGCTSARVSVDAEMGDAWRCLGRPGRLFLHVRRPRVSDQHRLTAETRW